MCGIAGIVNYDGVPVQQAQLAAMTNRMVHRGPDDEGFYVDGSAGIAMRRLSIIDLGGGHQPISNEDGSVWVVMNGEIYNYVELRRELKQRGHVFRTESDTEVIVHLYEEKGTAAVQNLNGMFGFALWDTRRRALWVVRDRLGIKPVFYSQDAGGVCFASDISALRGQRAAQVLPGALIEYLGLAYPGGNGTFFEGINKLSPGHFLWIEGGRATERRYWELKDCATWRGSPAEAQEHLRSLLLDAVHLQLRSDVPLGVFLSGGLDSSAIVALAAPQLPGPLQTLTVEFAGKGSTDARFARMVAQMYQTNAREISVNAEAATAEIDQLILRLDEPIGDSAIIASYLLARLARDAGLKVLLTGAGGDELFGGYRRHWPPRAGSPDWAAETLPAFLRKPLAMVASGAQRERMLRASDPLLAWGTSISGISLGACRDLFRSPNQYDSLVGAIRREFSEMPARQRANGWAYGRMLTDLGHYLPDDVLAINDKTTMAASVEGRVPLLDHRLVEFAYSLPESLNLANGRTKGLFREALSGVLPAELLNRGKDGFNAPLSVWLGGGGALDLEAELLEVAVPAVQSLISPVALESLLRNPRRRAASAPTLFSLYLFNRWSRLRA